MEIDIANISDLLQEVIEFLECLRDVQLSLTLENLREKLLTRSKNTLSLTTMPRGSPEPYLDMNSGPKSLLLRKSETDTEEYVGMEGSKRQSHHQDYYETFENEGQSVANERSEQNDDETEEGQTLIRIYKKLSAAQIKSKCHKCGPLFKKEGRKLFRLESRACWVALVGSHLLIYRNERHNQPYAIYPIRGYMARPAPNLIRDRQKSESAFEIYRPGNETLRFIARTPKDMEQWITKICEVGGHPSAKNAKVKVEGRGRKRRTNPVIESSTDRDVKDSTLDDLDNLTVKDESAIKDEEMQGKKDIGGNPPPLPARIPRRLPSLPPDDVIPSYKAVEDDDDEDDIYHKIEDLKNGTRYQNMMLSRKQRADKKHETVVAYDDVCAEESKNEGQTREGGDATPSEETYDDIALSRINATANSEWQNHDPHPDGEEKREEFYDDVENLLSNGKLTKDRAKDQSKSPQKKSFLGRVLSRKESPGKSDKRYKGKTSSSPPPSSTKEGTSIYDDASDVTMNHESLAVEGPEELPEYKCPPPPRPVYTKSTTLNDQVDQVEEFYDDVNACREQYRNQQTSLQESGVIKTRETPNNANTRQEANDDDLPQEEIEHYQSPRSDLCVHKLVENHQQNEEVLYDDIALLVDFTMRQRDINGKRDVNEDAAMRSTISPDKRSWNRKFVAINRKSRGSDSVETNRRGGANECEEIDIDSSEGNGATKRNTFQKLISRMENSLAKVSSRGNPSFPPTGK